MNTLVGYCETDGCRNKNKRIEVIISQDKIEKYELEPLTCAGCGKWLVQEIREKRIRQEDLFD